MAEGYGVKRFDSSALSGGVPHGIPTVDRDQVAGQGWRRVAKRFNADDDSRVMTAGSLVRLAESG
jgi:hypothetical protein